MENLMKVKSIVALVVCLAGWAFAPADASAQLLPGERESVIKGIPGVVAAGVKWELIWAGFETADGIVGTPDGGVIFAQEQTDTIQKINAAGKRSVFATELIAKYSSLSPITIASGVLRVA